MKQDTVVTRGLVSVVSRDRTGLQFQGSGEWYNLSKSQQEQVPLPSVGETVEVSWTPWTPQNGGQTRRYINSWRYVRNALADPDVPERDMGDFDPPVAEQWLRDDRPVVTRLACLNTAVAICNPTFGPESVDERQEVILGLAEVLVSWATWGGGA